MGKLIIALRRAEIPLRPTFESTSSRKGPQAIYIYIKYTYTPIDTFCVSLCLVLTSCDNQKSGGLPSSPWQCSVHVCVCYSQSLLVTFLCIFQKGIHSPKLLQTSFPVAKRRSHSGSWPWRVHCPWHFHAFFGGDVMGSNDPIPLKFSHFRMEMKLEACRTKKTMVQ